MLPSRYYFTYPPDFLLALSDKVSICRSSAQSHISERILLSIDDPIVVATFLPILADHMKKANGGDDFESHGSSNR